MSNRKKSFLFILTIYMLLNTIFCYGDLHKYSFHTITLLIGSSIAYFKPNWFIKLKGINIINTILYIRIIAIMIFLEITIPSLILYFFPTLNLKILDFIQQTLSVYILMHLIDNYPPDERKGWRAGISRRFKEMLDKYQETYPPQLAPIPI